MCLFPDKYSIFTRSRLIMWYYTFRFHLEHKHYENVWPIKIKQIFRLFFVIFSLLSAPIDCFADSSYNHAYKRISNSFHKQTISELELSRKNESNQVLNSFSNAFVAHKIVRKPEKYNILIEVIVQLVFVFLLFSLLWVCFYSSNFQLHTVSICRFTLACSLTRSPRRTIELVHW